MSEAIWEPAPPQAPLHLLDALPQRPRLLVHLTAVRLRCAALSRAGLLPSDLVLPGSGDPFWPTPEQVEQHLREGDEDAPPSCALPGFADAARRLARAVREGERVGIHGDYDVDGVTSVVLLTTWLRALGAGVEVFLPQRQRDGYGLGAEALRHFQSAGCRLVLAVDCGITAVEEARLAAELGLDLVILDHHAPGPVLPRPAILVDPALNDGCDDACLAAVGLAYRLCQAMFAQGLGAAELLPPLRELVALGTVADVCPLTGPNRALVRAGVEELRNSKRPGILALAMLAGLTLPRLRTEDIAFRLAPRLNAAGRLADPALAFDLLMSSDLALALQLAQQLEMLNRQRQTRTERATAEATAQLGMVNGKPELLFTMGTDWDPGIIGLVAGKLAERYYRPVVALAPRGERYVGSARSIDGFDIALALHSCRDLLVQCGGHARAAGLTVDAANVEPLRGRLAELASRALDAGRLQRRHRPEARVRLGTLTPDLLRELERLGPFGEGNRPPLLLAEGLAIDEVRGVGNGAHAQIHLADGATRRKGILFNADPAMLPPVRSRVDALFVPELDRYRGVEKVELRLTALRPATSPPTPTRSGEGS